MSRFIFLQLLALGLFLPQATAQEQVAGYTFRLNGKPLTPAFLHLDGTPERPTPTDLIHVDGQWMPLGTEKVQSFREGNRDEGILWMEKPGGKRQAVAATVQWRFTDEKDANGKHKKETLNPLTKLSPTEIRHLHSDLGCLD